MYEKSKSGWVKHWDFILADMLILLFSVFLIFTKNSFDLSVFYLDIFRNCIISVELFDFLIILMFNIYNNVLQRKLINELFVCMIQSGLITACTVVYLWATGNPCKYNELSLSAILYVMINFPVREVLKRIIKSKNKRNAEVSLYIAATAAQAPFIVNNIQEHNNRKYFIKGIFLIGTGPSSIEDIPVLGSVEHAAEYLRNVWADELLIDATDADFPDLLKEQCLLMGITVHTRILGNIDSDGNQFIQRVGSMTSLTSTIHTMTIWEAGLKRAVDIVGGALGCLITGILFVFIGPLIYIKSPGPIIFSQIRVGCNGKKFKMYKFRSMCLDAEERKADLEDENRVSDGRMFKVEFDPRVIGNEILPDGTHKTGIGDFIRRTSIDETPQFFNVLKGEMSLVGTRPPTVEEVEKYDFRHKSRLSTKPGITGMWQVNGRSQITNFEEVVKLDTDYIKNWSLGLDIKILFQTFKVVLLKIGSM